MRVAVLLEDRCKPNSNAFTYLKKYSGLCERECIQFDGDKCKILESACPVCFNRARHCPDNAVIVITHYQRLLDYIIPDYVHVLHEGKIVKSGDKNLAHQLEEKGYDWIK